MHRFAVCALALAVAACDAATQLPRLDPPDDLLARLSMTPARVDTYSFSQATVHYPADHRESHAVAVGDYLLARVLDRVGDARRGAVRLAAFEARCTTPAWAFLPRVTCQASCSVDMADGARTETLRARVSDMDVGPLMTSAGTSRIQNEVRTLIDALVANLRPAS